MARILVTGPAAGLAQRAALDRLVAKVRSDGHDAVRLGTQSERDLDAVRDADAIIALVDGHVDAGTAAALAFAAATGKPTLGLHGPAPPLGLLAELCGTLHGADDEAGWAEALPTFYEVLRPFAGRLVRDLVPRLVKEAGHEVAFRTLGPEERPRFLKQKILEEAQDLHGADVGREKEEIADVLEALESLIRTRSYGREDLKMVKDGKRKRRGGFEQGYVVESTAAAPSSASSSRPRAREPPAAGAAPTTPAAPIPPTPPQTAAPGGPSAGPAKTTGRGPLDSTQEALAGFAQDPRVRHEPPPGGPRDAEVADGDSTVYEYPDDDPVPPHEPPASVGPERRVEPTTSEL